MTNETCDIGDDLRILRITRQAAGNGTWVKGMVAGHRFAALVLLDQAELPEWKLGHSQISTLWMKRIETNREVINWDRGADVPAADDTSHAIVDFLAAGLAHHFALHAPLFRFSLPKIIERHGRN